MDGATFIKRFREETMDEQLPYLWSDSLILRYLDEAQTEFCRRTEGIEDSTSSICTINVPAGADSVTVSPKILKVRSVTIADTGRALEISSIEAERGGFHLFAGDPRTIVLKLNAREALIMPAAKRDIGLKLDVMRLPLNPIESPGDEVELDAMYDGTLMHYALYRAYSRPDPDSMDRVRADYFLQAFERACVMASREQGRARKGGGKTLFSW